MITLKNYVGVRGLYILLKSLEPPNDRLDKRNFIIAQNLIEMQDINCVNNTQIDSLRSTQKSRGQWILSSA